MKPKEAEALRAVWRLEYIAIIWWRTRIPLRVAASFAEVSAENWKEMTPSEAVECELESWTE